MLTNLKNGEINYGTPQYYTINDRVVTNHSLQEYIIKWEKYLLSKKVLIMYVAWPQIYLNIWLKICWNYMSGDHCDYLFGNSSKTDFDFILCIFLCLQNFF